MFDILNDPWIPVFYKTGKMAKVGLLAALRDAPEIIGVFDVNPLVEFSTYRFLQTFLMDALKPYDTIDLEDMMDEEAFDMAAIDDYIKTCQKEGVSFDLFDQDRPFLQAQCAEEKGDKLKPATMLDFARANGQNHTFFDHPNSREDGYMPDEAFRFLLPSYIFAVMDGVGYKFGINGVPPLFVWITGDNLFETLVNNMFPVPSDYFDDPPAMWRRKDGIKKSTDKPHSSVLEGMVFPARRIRLIQDEDGRVRQILRGPGESCSSGNGFRDPNVIVKEDGRTLRPSHTVPLWENIGFVMDVFSGRCPTVMSVYDSIHRDRKDLHVSLYGATTNQAKFLTAFKRDYTLPQDAHKDRARITVLLDSAAGMREVAKCLSKNLQNLPFMKGKDEKKDGVLKETVSLFYDSCWTHYCDLLSTQIRNETVTEVRDNFRWQILKEARRHYDGLLLTVNVPIGKIVDVERARAAFYKNLSKFYPKEEQYA